MTQEWCAIFSLKEYSIHYKCVSTTWYNEMLPRMVYISGNFYRNMIFDLAALFLRRNQSNRTT